MERPDICRDLIHFIRAYGLNDAYQILLEIIRTRKIIGSNKCIRGGYNCICFSEAPLHFFKMHFQELTCSQNHFQPFGIKISKRWLFELGGRPVIYEPEEDFDKLHESHKWRHVRFEPTSNPPIDFTWEREWRIKTDELRITELTAKIIMPTVEYARDLFRWYDTDQDLMVQMYTMIMDEMSALQYRKDFEWQIEIVNF